jgi:hypothetical protein
MALIEPINGSSELRVEKFPCDLNSTSCAAIEAASLAGKPENTCLSICSIFGRLFSFSEVVNGASQRVGPMASASGWYFSHWRLVLFHVLSRRTIARVTFESPHPHAILICRFGKVRRQTWIMSTSYMPQKEHLSPSLSTPLTFIICSLSRSLVSFIYELSFSQLLKFIMCSSLSPTPKRHIAAREIV